MTALARPRSRGLEYRTARKGWLFVLPAAILILIMSFYPMVEAFLLSLQTGNGNLLSYAGFKNYARLPKDTTYKAALFNTLIYLVIQVPIMLLLALLLASMLNDRRLLGKGIYRTLIFLPCATSLVSCSIIFLQLFSSNGLINSLLIRWGFVAEPVPFLTDAIYARRSSSSPCSGDGRATTWCFIWRAFRTSRATSMRRPHRRRERLAAVYQDHHPAAAAHHPLYRHPSTNGTLQLFDEVRIMTNGGPANATMSLSLYIYNTTFTRVAKFGYASAMAYTILVMVAFLSFVQMKVGERRE